MIFVLAKGPIFFLGFGSRQYTVEGKFLRNSGSLLG